MSRKLKIMRRNHSGSAFKHLKDGSATRKIQVVCGLVKEQHLRLCRQTARKMGALPLPP
jgi:hypothetical protein